MVRRILSLEERFWKFVGPETENGCRLWIGALHRQGYGHFNVNGETKFAHRVAWELAFGQIPEGLHCLHRCDQTGCVFVGHLFLGSHQDNHADKARKGRGPKSKRGLPYGVSVDSRSPNRQYVARASDHGKLIRLGQFSTMEEAATVALEFKTKAYSIGTNP